jgi:hypothetical protein
VSLWSLPKAHSIGGTVYDINTDYRDILEIIQYLTDESRPEFIRWQIAVSLFYNQDIPDSCMQEAMEYIAEFIAVDRRDKAPGPKLLDWEQDAHIIISDINKVPGKEIRSVHYMHWWTFVSLFSGIGEGQLSTIVSIRHKKATGKKLEKWEQEFYREHKSVIDFHKSKTPEDEAVKAYFEKWL